MATEVKKNDLKNEEEILRALLMFAVGVLAIMMLPALIVAAVFATIMVYEFRVKRRFWEVRVALVPVTLILSAIVIFGSPNFTELHFVVFFKHFRFSYKFISEFIFATNLYPWAVVVFTPIVFVIFLKLKEGMYPTSSYEKVKTFLRNIPRVTVVFILKLHSNVSRIVALFIQTTLILLVISATTHLESTFWSVLFTYFAISAIYCMYRFIAAELNEAVVSPDAIVFGKSKVTNLKAYFNTNQIQHHMHVLGASGFGKTTFLSHLIKHHVEHGLGLIFIDLKADQNVVSEITYNCMNAKRIDDLKILDLSRPEISLSYNPCSRGNATEIKDKIVGAFQWESEYYKNVAQSFLLSILKSFVFLRDNHCLSFTLQDILDSASDPSSLSALLSLLNKNSANPDLIHDITTQGSLLKNKDSFRELQGLRTQLKLLLDSEFGVCLKAGTSGIDFFNAIKGKSIVYVLLDSQTYGETAERLGKLILQDLKSCSGEIVTKIPKESRTHCTIIVDEFADLVTESFVGLLNRARGSKIGIVISHQEIADLTTTSDSVRDQIMANTSTTISFLQKVPESAERIAALIGTKTVTKVTRQTAEEGLFFKSQVQTGMQSEREVEEFHVHPNVIKNLPRGRCVVVSKYPNSYYDVVDVSPPEVNDFSQYNSADIFERLKKESELNAKPVELLKLRSRVAINQKSEVSLETHF